MERTTSEERCCLSMDSQESGESIVIDVASNNSKMAASRHVSICRCPIQEWKKNVTIVYAEDDTPKPNIQSYDKKREEEVEIVKEIIVLETVETVEERRRFVRPRKMVTDEYDVRGKFSLFYGTEGYVWRDNIETNNCLLDRPP